MKIMSFNTQHCLNFKTKKIDFEVMANAILECGADIVGLQEMRGDGPDEEYTPQTEELSRLTGMTHYAFAPALHLSKGLYGNALLSRYPILSVENIPIPDPEGATKARRYETRCILKAKLACGLTVMVSHFGLNADERQNAVETVLKNIELEKCVLMGDFNAGPQDAVLDPIRNVMKDTADLFATPLFSWPSDEPKYKIDYLFATPDLEVISADIPAIVASDHRPYIADILL